MTGITRAGVKLAHSTCERGECVSTQGSSCSPWSGSLSWESGRPQAAFLFVGRCPPGLADCFRDLLLSVSPELAPFFRRNEFDPETPNRSPKDGSTQLVNWIEMGNKVRMFGAELFFPKAYSHIVYVMCISLGSFNQDSLGTSKDKEHNKNCSLFCSLLT